MERKRMNEILQKYYEGKTSVEEEKQLKQAGVIDELENSDMLLQKYYKTVGTAVNTADLKASIHQTIKEKSTKTLVKRIMYVSAAAIIIISLGIGYIMYQQQHSNTFTTNDPDLAYVQTKQTLELVSYYLNKGTEELEVLPKIEKNINYLKYLELINTVKLEEKNKIHE